MIIRDETDALKRSMWLKFDSQCIDTAYWDLKRMNTQLSNALCINIIWNLKRELRIGSSK